MDFEAVKDFDLVLNKSFAIMDEFKRGSDFDQNLETARQKFQDNCVADTFVIPERVEVEKWQKFQCDVCESELTGELAYKAHMNGKRHKKQE